MTGHAQTASRGDRLLYLIGILLSVPPLISLIQRQFDVPTALQIQDLVMGYRTLSDTAAKLVHAPLFGVGLPPPPPLIDLHLLSFAGMGMMTKGMQQPGEKIDWMGGLVWAIAAFVMAWLLIGILVIAAILARMIANPLIAFRSDHYIETTPLLEGLQGRLKREREMRLERDLARIMLISLALVGCYFGLNGILLSIG
ncbi:MAG: hypothetical protein QM773_18565 [Hyphomonadaceae bacterium]